MKKLFFAICFIVFSAVLITPSNAAIKQMRDEIALQQYNADKSMQTGGAKPEHSHQL